MTDLEINTAIPRGSMARPIFASTAAESVALAVIQTSTKERSA